MSRVNLFAAVAMAATVAGLASAVDVAAAPAAPAHSAHQRPASVIEPVADQPAVRWSRGTDGKVTGQIYRGGVTSPAARLTSPSFKPAATRAAAQRAVERLAAPPALTAADVPPADQALVTGRVYDAALHPLAGVDVVVFPNDSDAPITTVTTNGNGFYSATVAAGGYFVGYDGRSATGGDADATGYIPTGETIHLEPQQHLVRNPRLKAGALVHVRVTDTAGHPLAGVEPYVQPISPYAQSDLGDFFVGVAVDSVDGTGSDGTASLRGLSVEAGLVCVSTVGVDATGGDHDAIGYTGRCARRPIAPAPGSTTNFPTIRLAAASGGAIRGVVTAHGHPVKHGFVIADGRRAGSGEETGADGSYRITGLPAGAYQVCAETEAPGKTGLGFAPTCKRVVVKTGKVLTENLVLHRGAAIEGTITGPTGSPVVDAAVYATGRNGGSAGITDADGHYVISGLPSGAFRVCVDPLGALDAGTPSGDRAGCYQHKTPVSVHTGAAHAGIDIRLRAGGAIAGQVTGPGGAPAPDVDVAIESISNPEFGDTVTDANGDYQLSGLSPGQYQICLFAFDEKSGGIARCSQAPITVRTGEITHVDKSLAPNPSLGAVSVTVRDEQGRRVQGVDIGLLKPCGSPHSIFCDVQPLFGHPARLVDSEVDDNAGRFVFGGRKAGPFAVCLFAYYGVTTDGAPPTGYTDRCAGRGFGVTVRSGQTTHLNLTLHPGGRVEGRVVDHARRPVRNALVQIAHSAAADYVDDLGLIGGFGPVDQPSPQADARTRKDGTFAVRGVRPGAETECVEVRPTADRVSTCADRKVTVEANATAHAPVLKLDAPGAVSGRVTTAKGKPAKNVVAFVVIPGSDPQPAGVTVTNERGHYRVGGLAAGRYEVCFVDSRLVGECYRHVRWKNVRHAPPPADMVKVLAGRTTKHVDVVLPKQ